MVELWDLALVSMEHCTQNPVIRNGFAAIDVRTYVMERAA